MPGVHLIRSEPEQGGEHHVGGGFSLRKVGVGSAIGPYTPWICLVQEREQIRHLPGI